MSVLVILVLPPGESRWVCADGADIDRRTDGRKDAKPLHCAFR